MLWLVALSCHPHMPVPANGVYHGAYTEFGPYQDDVSMTTIDDFEALAQKKLAMVGFGNFWGQAYFPKAQLQVIKEYGAIPLIYWCPWGQPYEKWGEQPAYSLDTIIAGKYDNYVKVWADSAKKWGRTIFVSLAPEMNGETYPWTGDFNGGDVSNQFGDTTRPDGPERFVAAYRHVKDLVKNQGVKNIYWVFHPDAQNVLEDDWNAIKSYYPGDAYADWLGMSAYGCKSEDYDWISFDTVVGPGYAQLDSLSATKPLMLAQWGVGEVPDEGNKAAWLDTAFTAIKERYPRLKAAVYWHERWSEDEVINDLRIDSSTEALETYRERVKDSHWLARP